MGVAAAVLGVQMCGGDGKLQLKWWENERVRDRVRDTNLVDTVRVEVKGDQRLTVYDQATVTKLIYR